MNASVRAACLVACVAAAVFAACTGDKDLGQKCKMTRPCGDGGTCAIAPASVDNAAVDYVALGVAECDDLTCLRSARSDNPANEATTAFGYCTAPCIDSSDCTPDYTGAKGTLNCEQLFLDEKYLDELKKSNPELYERVFGDDVRSKYCLKPRQ